MSLFDMDVEEGLTAVLRGASPCSVLRVKAASSTKLPLFISVLKSILLFESLLTLVLQFNHCGSSDVHNSPIKP